MDKDDLTVPVNAVKRLEAELAEYQRREAQHLEQRVSLGMELGQILGRDYDGVSLPDLAREFISMKERLEHEAAAVAALVHQQQIQEKKIAELERRIDGHKGLVNR
jgi:phage shock protein A